MFNVEGNTITLSRGDTGTVTIGVSGYTFGSNDRALFTVAGGGEVKMRRELPIVDGVVTIEFVNSDTDSLNAGNYSWDIRFVMNPMYDQESGLIYDGDEVNTPELPMPLVLLPTVGQI